VKTFLCPSDTIFQVVNVTTCGSPPQPANTPQPLTDGAMSSYIGCLGGADASNPDPKLGCYEYQPFSPSTRSSTATAEFG
jgi:hypothetical protein